MNRRRKSRGKARNYLGESAGSTLVELVTAMALMMLLLAVSAKGLVGYYRYVRQKKQEDRAQEVYLAAQTELTRRIQSGGAQGVEELAANSLSGRPHQCEREEEGAQGIYCLEARGGGGGVKGDYERYKKGELRQGSREDEEIRFLYELIEPYIWDKTVLTEGTIHLEIYLPDGLVCGAFYSSHHPQGFGGSEVLALRREAGTGRGDIGYYGVDSLPSPVPEPGPQPRIWNLKLSQQAGLTVSWRVEGAAIDTWERLTYLITLYGGDRGQEVLGRIVLNPEPGAGMIIDNGYHSIQGIGIFHEVPEWYRFLIQMDGYHYQITLLLDPSRFWEMEEREGILPGLSEASPAQAGALPAQTLASPAQAALLATGRSNREEASDFSLFSQLEQEGWDPRLLECLSCTVTAYGKGYGIAAVKESNSVHFIVQEEEEQDAEREMEPEDPPDRKGEAGG